MLKLKELVIQNYKSYGNKKVRVRLDDFEGLTLIMGKNEDSTDDDARNGCGKSTIFDALKWVMTGKTIKPAKPPTAVVNRINGKKAMVTLDFELGMYEARIERGFKPGVCRFYKKLKTATGEITDQIFDCTKDSITNTNKDIIDFTRIDGDIFNLVMVTAAKTDNFFDMDAEGQRNVIEMLFGYSVLSQKAEALKKMRQTRETDLALEKTRLDERKGYYERNKAKLTSLRERSTQWCQTNTNRISEATATINELSVIDLEQQESLLLIQQLQSQERLDAQQKKINAVKESNTYNNQVKQPTQTKLDKAESVIRQLKEIDVESFLTAYEAYEVGKKETETEMSEIAANRSELTREYNQFQKEISTIKQELNSISDTCPTCGQAWPDHDARENKIETLKSQIIELETARNALDGPMERLQMSLSELRLVSHDKPTQFKSRDDALRASSDLDNARKMVEELRHEMVVAEDRYDELEAAVTVAEKEFAAIKETHSQTDFTELLVEDVAELTGFKTMISEATKQKEQLETETDPYQQDIAELETEVEGDFDTSSIVAIETDIKAHVDLINLLTKKESPIRREVTSVKLPALNHYVAEYLDKLDLQYIVRFNDDLTPSTFDFDQEGSFSVMSSGEEERVGVALSWAFRDLFERMNFPINFYGIDERLDSGMDGPGAERAVAVLYEMAQVRKRNIFLISHRKEMVDYADRIMITTKKNRITSVGFE